MSEITDFRQVQRRIHQLMSFEDGLWDLLLGVIYIMLATYPVTRELLGPEWNLALFISLLVMLVVAQLVIRRFVSEPRIGHAIPRLSPKLYLLGIFTVVMVLITIGLVLLTFLSPVQEASSGVLTEVSPRRSYVVELITLLVMGGLFTAMGYGFGVVRLYFYGWMLGLAYLASIYMEHNAGWTFLIPLAIAAWIILLIGFMLLRRFLRKYPVRSEEA